MARRGLLLMAILLAFPASIGLHAQAAADADFDDNGAVGFSDFLLFAKAYGTSQAEYDLNGNGKVDFSDFLTFARVYGQKTTPSGDIEMEFVYIEPGTFLMGTTEAQEQLLRDKGLWTLTFGNEQPDHQVAITQGFYLGKYEVTQGQWEAVMGATPWSGKEYVQANPDHPAVYVSWNDAQAFIHKLNVAAGDSLYRLPTEAEWEYACRAGTTTLWSFGDDENLLGDYAWYRDNTRNAGEEYAHKVGTKKPNPWGLHDMHGNVGELCQDWYSLHYYSDSPSVDPQGPASSPARARRGGFYSQFSRYERSAYRFFSSPLSRSSATGIRLLRRAD